MEKINAMLSGYFGIAHPEELPDELYWRKYRQLEWFLDFDARRHDPNNKDKGVSI